MQDNERATAIGRLVQAADQIKAGLKLARTFGAVSEVQYHVAKAMEVLSAVMALEAEPETGEQLPLGSHPLVDGVAVR